MKGFLLAIVLALFPAYALADWVEIVAGAAMLGAAQMAHHQERKAERTFNELNPKIDEAYPNPNGGWGHRPDREDIRAKRKRLRGVAQNYHLLHSALTVYGIGFSAIGITLSFQEGGFMTRRYWRFGGTK